MKAMIRGKRMKAAFACAAVAVSAVVGMIAPVAEVDLAKTLVGRWDGDVNATKDSYPRTLVIESVQESDGKWIAAGAFGDPDRRMHPVDITIDTVNGDVVLRFTNPGMRSAPVVLTLYKDGKHLFGTVGRHAGRTRGDTDRIKLEKTGSSWR